MSFFVYIHTCPNQKRYVGITTAINPELRWCKGRGYHKNMHFTNAINKYGWDNIEHEVFETQSVELMSYWERILIYHYNTMDSEFGYNKTGGGENINGLCLSDDTKKKISEGNKGKKKPAISEDTRKRLSDAGKRRKHSDDTKKKISDSNKGKRHSEDTRKRLSESAKGRTPWNKGKKLPPYSEEYREHMRIINTGKKHSEDAKKKMSEAKKLYWENKRKNNK